jgi:hypothetical protein
LGRRLGAQPPEQRIPVAVRIGDDKIGRIAPGGDRQIPHVARRLDAATRRGEHAVQPIAHIGLALANEDSRRAPIRRADQRAGVGAAGQHRGESLLRWLATRRRRVRVLPMPLGNAGSPEVSVGKHPIASSVPRCRSAGR